MTLSALNVFIIVSVYIQRLCCNAVVFLSNQAARKRGVDCVVAPYEADAQLAHLTRSGLAQAVITEDSDLLAFGCKKVFCATTSFTHGRN